MGHPCFLTVACPTLRWCMMLHDAAWHVRSPFSHQWRKSGVPPRCRPVPRSDGGCFGAAAGRPGTLTTHTRNENAMMCNSAATVLQCQATVMHTALLYHLQLTYAWRLQLSQSGATLKSFFALDFLAPATPLKGLSVAALTPAASPELTRRHALRRCALASTSAMNKKVCKLTLAALAALAQQMRNAHFPISLLPGARGLLRVDG